MTHEQLIVAQAEAFTILRDLMHIKPDDPRPQRIINTIKQAALAILRLKPLSPKGDDRRVRQYQSGEGGPRTHTPSETPHPKPETRTPDSDPTSQLTDEQFDELIARLPHNTLYPRTDKQRDRLARHFAAYHLPCTDDIKAAIVNRASRRSSHSDTDPQGPPREAPRRAA